MLPAFFSAFFSASLTTTDGPPLDWHTISAGDVYVGSYRCGSPAWLLLQIEEASEKSIKAVFHFVYPSSTQHGAYLMRGSWDEKNSRILNFEPGAWIHAAIGKVVPVGLMGIFSSDGNTFSGEVMHKSCGKFEVNRTSLDVAPPETTIYFDSPGGKAEDYEMTISAGDEDDPDASQWRPHGRLLIRGVAGLVEEARRARRARASGQEVDAYGRASPGSSDRAGDPIAPMPPAATAPAHDSGRTALGALPQGAQDLWQGEGISPELAQKMSLIKASVLRGLHARDFALAYSTWADSCETIQAAPRREIAQQIISEILQGAQLVAADDPYAAQRRTLAALAVFGGDHTVGRGIASVLSEKSTPPQEVVFAEANLRVALNRSGCHDLDAALLAADAASGAGDLEAARGGYENLINRQPEWAWPQHKLGDLLFRRLGERAEGLRYLQRAADQAPYDVFAWSALMLARREANEIPAALAAYSQVNSWHPHMMPVQRLRQWATAVEDQLRVAHGIAL